jgi:DNA-binding response OmpR family regulator
LFISPTAEDDAALRHITSSLSWEVSTAATCNEARDQLRQARVSAIICESVLADGTWKDILHHIAESASPPRLIVTSRLADEYLWAEVLNLGGYDVLAEPFSEREVCHVLMTISLCQVNLAPAARTAGAA